METGGAKDVIPACPESSRLCYFFLDRRAGEGVKYNRGYRSGVGFLDENIGDVPIFVADEVVFEPGKIRVRRR